MKKHLLAVILLFTVLIGCKKDDDCDLSNERLVGSYRLTALTYTPSGGATQNVYLTYLDACERDDIFVFNANATANYVDAGTTCVPANNYVVAWSLSGNSLNIDGELFNVASFDCSAMVLTLTDPSAPGDVLTFTYTRQ